MTSPSRNPKRQRQKEGAQARRAAELAAQRRRLRTRRIVRFAVAAGVAIAAIFIWSWQGGDDDEEPLAATTTTTEADAEGTTTTEAAGPVEPLECEAPSGENTDLQTKPTIDAPDAPARDLTCQDLVVGDGDEVTSADARVTVHYVGVGQASGEEFDSSWEGTPATFSLRGVIAGWTNGIPGMKVGGRRLLTIPGVMAYGPSGNPDAGIAPDETLVFVIDLLEVEPGA